ncbi:glycosyltransferase [Cohnella sp. LGH]|uniref:glycosyltransferase n=1 Tax=Cohnella sp. LGH TaxID=1619153 RepID=UPI001ADCB9DA|nr:glycosyltransferase [Cohnella sp. LGH]QTH42333.1 glycosyltransferase [Cohnella sp. LGH]
MLKSILEANPERSVFIFPSPGSPWGYMFQRPQQLAKALAEQGNLVFYFGESSFPYEPDWSVRGAMEMARNLYLYSDGRQGTVLLEELRNREAYVWQYWPSQLNFAKKASSLGIRTIYDCIDHLTTFRPYAGIAKDFEKSLHHAQWLLATSKSIEEELIQNGYSPQLVPNGVSICDFVTSQAADWPELDKLKAQYKVIVGYYGAIAPWFDFELVQYAAKANPNWAFVIVGEVYAEVRSQVEGIQRQCANMYFMPRTSYNRIPALLAYFDIAILPFLINDITRSTSPVKIFEYMAGGKATVSTALPEVIGYEGVLVAEDKEQFQSSLVKAHRLMMDPVWPERIRQAAVAHTWDRRVSQVLRRLGENGCEA